MSDLPAPESSPKTPPIATFNRAVDAFDIGQLIGEIRWHVQVATLTGSRQHEKFARECAEEIKPHLTSLFPDQNGGEAKQIVQKFLDTWNTLDTEAYVDDFSELFHQFGSSLDFVDVVNGLRPFLAKIDEDLYSAGALALKDDSHHLRALHLGLCISAGLFPKANGEDVFEIIDNSGFGPWPMKTGFEAAVDLDRRQSNRQSPKTGIKRGTHAGKATNRRLRSPKDRPKQPTEVDQAGAPVKRRGPYRVLRVKLLNPGDLVPANSWSDEVIRLLDSVGITEPVPVSLEFASQQPNSRCDSIESLCDWIRKCFFLESERNTTSNPDPLSGSSSSDSRDSNAPIEQAVGREKSEDDWIHDAGDKPPNEFGAGPLVGSLTQLGFAVRPVNKPAPREDKSYRGDLSRAAKARGKPMIWVRRCVTDDQYQAFFRETSSFRIAELRLLSFDSRPKKKSPRNKPHGRGESSTVV